MLCIMQSFCLLIPRVQVLFSCIGNSNDVSLCSTAWYHSLKVLFLDFSGISLLNFSFSLVLYGIYALIYLLMIASYRPSQGLSPVI